jgi:hypothetical protein
MRNYKKSQNGMFGKMVSGVLLLLLVMALSQQAHAVLLTFDEMEDTPVVGLTAQGVIFGFKVNGLDSTDAAYGSGGPGDAVYVQDPSLEGDAMGVLTLDFEVAVDQIQFGMALSADDGLDHYFTVELFDGSLASMGVTSVATSFIQDFHEALFTYGGPAVKRAVIDFDETPPMRFAMDNLSFNPVPEPTTICLLGLGGLMFGRKRKA